MKKLLIIMTLIMAISCSKSESVRNDGDESTITLRSFNSVATSRAANDSSSNYIAYGYVAGGATLINGEQINGSDNSFVSGASYYWPVDAGLELTLVAYAPSTLEYSPLTSSSWSYTVPATGDEDFTISKIITRTCPKLDTTTGGIPEGSSYIDPVEFVFYHQLSNVGFEVSLSQTLIDAGFELDIDNLYIDFTVNYNSALFDYTTQVIDEPNISSLSLSSADDEDTNVKYTAKTSYYIMPQDGDDCVIEIFGAKVYSPTGTDILDGKVITPYVITSSDNLTFKQGYLYTIKITFDDSLTTGEGDDVFTMIEISDTKLNEWVTDSDSQIDTSTDEWSDVTIE